VDVSPAGRKRSPASAKLPESELSAEENPPASIARNPLAAIPRWAWDPHGHPSAADQAATAAAPGRQVELHLDGIEHPSLAAMGQPGVRFRLPTFADLKAIFNDKTLKIPESVVKARVAQLLGRMAFENRLESTDDVATIMGKIFPAPGVIDEAEFQKVVDETDRTEVYQSVLDAKTKVQAGDKPNLQVAMADARDLITQVEGDDAGLKDVFGTKAKVAKTNYGKAKKALKDVSDHMDTLVTTDYNLDADEVFLDGWATFAPRHMHLLSDIVKVVDPAETKTTLIHEASHLADPSVDDMGYYGSPGFEGRSDLDKVHNAAHYEELPRRLLGTSSFVGVTFTPGMKKGGGALTPDDRVKDVASEYLRKAWDAAVDVHELVRGVRAAALAGSAVPFAAHKALLLKVSRLMDLTIHTQDPAHATVTQLDVTLTESIAHGVSLLQDIADKEPVPSLGPPRPADAVYRDQIVAAAVTKFGNLLGDPVKDKALLDWLAAHFHAVPGI
jgi:hypothetical protein